MSGPGPWGLVDVTKEQKALLGPESWELLYSLGAVGHWES